MKRRLFTILSAASLLLCVAVVMLWVSSYAHGRGYYYLDSDCRVSRWFTSVGGRLQFGLGSGAKHYFTPMNRWERQPWRLAEPNRWERMDRPWKWPQAQTGGYHSSDIVAFPDDMGHYGYRRGEAAYSLKWIAISYRAMASAFLFLPACWIFVRLWQRRRLKRNGLCPSCGYDLRATPDRCPECGHVPTSKPQEVAA